VRVKTRVAVAKTSGTRRGGYLISDAPVFRFLSRAEVGIGVLKKSVASGDECGRRVSGGRGVCPMGSVFNGN
jgi:hypothetical protein